MTQTETFHDGSAGFQTWRVRDRAASRAYFQTTCFSEHVKKNYIHKTSLLSINGLSSGLAYRLNRHTTQPLPYTCPKNQLKLSLFVCLISLVLKPPDGIFERRRFVWPSQICAD